MEDKLVKNYISYVSGMIDKYKVLGKIISEDTDCVTPERLNTALAYYYDVSSALNAEYQRVKIEYLVEKQNFSAWKDEIFERAKKQIISETTKSVKPSVTEYEIRSRNDNCEEYNFREMSMIVAENKMNFILRMIDMVKSYKDILITLSNNMRQEMRSLYLDSEMNDSKIRDVEFP